MKFSGVLFHIHTHATVLQRLTQILLNST